MSSIRDICTRDVVVVPRETTVGAAAQLMRHHHVGAIVVVDQGNGGRRVPLGIVTDRDIVVEVVAAELRPDTITVGDIMGAELVTARETEGTLQALEIMHYKGVRRLPVVREDGHLVGIVTIDDLLAVLAEELGDIARTVARGRSQEAAARV
jgi:CBS domain-containing protein